MIPGFPGWNIITQAPLKRILVVAESEPFVFQAHQVTEAENERELQLSIVSLSFMCSTCGLEGS